MTQKEILDLLSIDNFSSDYYRLLNESDEATRRDFGGRGYIFVQIGINGAPCNGNCKFCSMAKKYYSLDKEFEKSEEEIADIIKSCVNEKVDDIFLMTTANYNFNKFIRMGELARSIIPDDVRLVANTCDMTYDMAKDLKEAGYTGAYHIKRLREGTDTEISPEIRIRSIENIRKAGLELYYCIEPIGPEHTYDEIADEILYASTLNVGAMAVMRRTAVSGTCFYEKGQIDKAELLKIGAVARLAVKPTRSMNIHETVETSLITGVNQLYAETGSNPRDNSSETSQSRGLSIKAVKNLFDEYSIKYGN